MSECCRLVSLEADVEMELEVQKGTPKRERKFGQGEPSGHDAPLINCLPD